MPTYLYRVAKFWDGSSEGWQYGSALHRLLPNASWQELLPGLVCEWLNCLTDSSRFLSSILQNKNSVWPHLNCMDRSVSAFLNCTNGSVWSDLNFTDGSVWSDLNCMHGRFRMVWPKFGILYWDSISSHQIYTFGVFWHTLSIMQEMHWKNLFEIEWSSWLPAAELHCFSTLAGHHCFRAPTPEPGWLGSALSSRGPRRTLFCHLRMI